MRRLAFALIVGAASHPASAGDLIPCRDQTVQYVSPSGIIDPKRITLEKILAPLLEASVAPSSEALSPQGDSAFAYLLRPDTTKGGTYDTVVLIYRKRGAVQSWKLSILDTHDLVHFEWLNEELLFFRAWWGRIYSTDAILNTTSGAYVYFREANYGDLVAPCE
jgi:hypothetical protein